MKSSFIYLLIITVLIGSGCAQAIQRNIVAPSENHYYEGNEYYEFKEYELAVESYTKYLELKPSGLLSVPTKLNLGMSYYYLENYVEAEKTLSALKLEDESIKTYIQKIIDESKSKISAAKPEPEQELASAQPSAPTKDIIINVLDAYLDDSDDLYLSGKIDQAATIMIAGQQVRMNPDKTFSTTVSWKKGESVQIMVENTNNKGELQFFPDNEPPDKPRGLQASNISDNSVEVYWDENDEEDIKGYELYYRLSGTSWKEVRELIEDDTLYEVVGLAAQVQGSNRTFEFQLKAIDKMYNESDPSDILEATLP